MRTLGGADSTQHWTPQDVGTSGSPRLAEAVAKASGPEESGRFRLRPGSLIPGTRLCVEGWLGEGATAVVYRGVHVDLGRKLAIKVLRQPNPPTATRERFLAEARRTSELDSEFVVDVIDFGRLEDGRLYYAMAFLDGRPLDEILRERSLPVPRAIALLRMACKGLQAAHDHGIVHRDIKPGNLMVISRRKQEHLVVVDFGIATAAGHTAQDVRGTPHTMAPEQIGGGVVDARTDVYALGCCAFQMLTGLPFADGETVFAILADHLDDIRPRIGPVHGVPKVVADVVHRCLELRPEDRFESARELEAALCEAQIAAGLYGGGEHLPPPDVDEPRRTRIATGLARTRRRGKARSIVLAALCALVILLVSGGWARARMAAVATDRAVVEQVVEAVHDAAAQSRFVYSLPLSNVPTAYHHVVRLEHWDGPARGFAEERSASLRAELGQVLLVLGDGSWDQPGAQGHARDYYAQALIFDPSLERARERVGLTPGELAELRHKASTDSFSTTELELVAALVPAGEGIEPVPVEPGGWVEIPRTSEPVPRQRGLARAVAAKGSPAVERDPRRARGLVRSANRASHAGRHGEARTLYERALELDDRNADAYAGLSDVCLEDGQLERALRYAKLAARRAPNVVRHRLRLASSYEQAGHHDQAIAEYRKAAALGSWKARRRLEQLDRG